MRVFAVGRFSIDPEVGLIVARSVFDREQTSLFEFHVSATVLGPDGTVGHSSTVPVRVRILDADDESPRFAQPKYTFFVPENAALRSVVGRTVAVDRDLPPFDRLWYDLEQHHYHHHHHEKATAGRPPPSVASFAVDPLTGDIYTQTSLDRETKEMYAMTVKVYGSGVARVPGAGAAADGVAAVSVVVTDVNDNRPLILFPNDSAVVVRVSSAASVGDVIASVVATDDDIGPNAHLSYVITGGNDDGAFRLASDTGVLWLGSSLLSSSSSSSNGGPGTTAFRLLALTVRDDGVPSLNSTVELRVEVVTDSSPSSPNPADYHRQTTRQASETDSGGGIGMEDSHVIVVVMAVAGCLAVSVACGLVVALIQKSVRKMADRKVVWSQLMAAEADCLQQQQQQRARENSYIRSEPEVVRPEEKTSLDVTQLSDVILCLESEPVSFAVGTTNSSCYSYPFSSTIMVLIFRESEPEEK